MKEFQFDKSYEEFKIGGKVYKMRFDDEAVKGYRKKIEEYENDVKDLRELDESTLSPDEQQAKHEEAVAFLKKFIDDTLGEGAFDELYEASGRSSHNMKTLVEWLGVFIAEKTHEFKKKTIKKYKK